MWKNKEKPLKDSITLYYQKNHVCGKAATYYINLIE